MATMAATAAATAAAPTPGEIVLTRYGVATVLQNQPAGASLCALWRIPGQSVASAATATLRVSSIVRRDLPAAPGMVVRAKGNAGPAAAAAEGEGEDGEEVEWMVMSYSAQTDTYELKATATAKDTARVHATTTTTISASDLRPSKAAKVVPLLHQLMQRADEASHRARVFMDSTPVKELTTTLEQRATDLATKAADVAGRDIDLEARGSQVASDLRAEVEARMPDGQEMRAIYDMLKDEELTVLLEKAQTKLRQLVDDELPKATEAALKTAGIEVDLASPTSPTGGGEEKAFFSMTMVEQSREKALQKLNGILAKQGTTTGDVATIKQEMAQQFGTMFDSLAEAAGSDHTLSSIFEQLNERTSEWQAISGRLLSTRSVGVFMEGTARLRKRAQDMFFSQGGSGGLELTKAFTEGDVAVARLKTLELGDAVRSRLVGAIELRSESAGGLDGMIAGALKSLSVDAEALPFAPSATAANVQSDLRNKISGLQDAADLKTKDAKESLISLISQKSLYRDLALLRIEATLVDLESHLDLSAEEMASLASGEGGTAALLQPLARKAGKEIEKQLHSIEASVAGVDGADDTASAILSHVRRIVSGDMSIGALVEEVTDLLNDGTLAAAGEDLLTKGETILDAFEGRSGNKTIDDVVAAAEKAGITKSVVMQRMQSIDVDSVLDTASSAATDEDARRELLSTATDQALDFLLNILPSMPVPPFDGVKDGVVYNLSNLSLEGFKVAKEDIGVSIAGIRAGKGSELVSDIDETKSKAAIARELLTIDVENISATLDNAAWSFEQTYLPYLKGGGLADSKLWEGCIKLQFELKKQRKNPSAEGGEEWEPRLCLSERFVSIGEVELKLQGDGKLTWILNKLAEMFKMSLRDYCVSVIASAILKRSGWLLARLNTHLAPYWPVILRTAQLDMKDLAEVTETDVSDETGGPSDLVYDLVFRDQVPLGINLLLNDESGFVRVVDFPRGSQSRKVATENGVDPDLFKSATVISVNGTEAQRHHQGDVMAALKDPGRPKIVGLKIADDVAEAERVRTFAMSSVHGGDEEVVNSNNGLILAAASPAMVEINIANDGPLGVKFSRAIDDLGLGLATSDSRSNGIVSDGALQDALGAGKLVEGDILSHINGVIVLGRNGAGRERALEQLQQFGGKRPLLLQFVKPASHLLSFQQLCVEGLVVGGAEELVLEENKMEGRKRVVIKSFDDVAGLAEQNGIFIGDQLISVNGFPVGAGCLKHGDPMPDFKHVLQIIVNESPLALTFARPRREERWTNVMGSNAVDIIDGAETYTVTASDADQLGCNFSEGQMAGTIAVGSFKAVKGCVRQEMEKQLGNDIIGLSIESVAGQVVPSYASPAMVKAAVARNWPTDIIFKNIAQEEWLGGL